VPPTSPNDPMAMTAAMTQAVAERSRAAADAHARQEAEAKKAQAAYGPYAAAVERATRRNREFTQSVRDGTYARQAREMARLGREYEKVRREAELIARYGRTFGGLAARYGAGLRVAGGVATAAYGAGAAMVGRGFSGTVEMNRFLAEFKIASREMAGAFTPALNTATRMMRRFSDRLARMGPDQQDRLMYGGLAVGGGLAAHALLRRTAGVGLGGAIAGAGSWLTGGWGAAAAGAGAGLGARAMGGLKSAAKKLPGVAIAAGLADEALDDDGYYEMLRRRGTSKLGSAIGAAGGVGLDLVTFGAFGRRMRERGELGAGDTGADPSRRRVTLPGGGFQDAGAGYEAIAEAYGQVAAAPEEVKILTDIRDTLARFTGVAFGSDAPLDRPAGVP